ncbi:probable cytochrome P450 6a14 [Phlebotomus argentipes]|uniref:probable cytochrome P450 6a14 n=1 Tax=Phlebotomus argentipes TaxID=94469 RepID=UPI002892F258|nr:probable cytochrome P450 6a14 [Phlebotomus argentipes]XP_059610498.1 probable cytochrome P450 6a14 [Phlebotomus argentipes]
MGCIILLIGFVTLVAIGYFFVKKKYSYWEERGFPHLKATFPMGSVWGVGYKKHVSLFFQDAYREMKGKDVVGGMYFMIEPTLLVMDLDFTKTILIKDFQYFHDRGVYVNERDDPLTANLFGLSGQKWRVLRGKLSPTFTSGKMKMMHTTIIAVAEEFGKFLQPYAKKGEEVEWKDILARFTTDVIGNCAFGVDCNSLKDPNTEFRQVGKKIFQFGAVGFIKILFIQVFPNAAKALRMKTNSDEIANFFMKLLKDTIEYREKNNVKRNDFLSLLIQLKNTGKLEGDSVDLGKLTFEELAAQTFVFFGAGFETSSAAMSFALYELALNQEIQDRAREEIKSILEKHEGNFTYDACMELKYLERIIQETLRKYPVVDNVLRTATNDYQIPGDNRVIQKGIALAVPVYAIHHDPEIWPNPERFDPDRFTEENIRNRHSMAWMPFGEGPRMCIGMRFALMQTRVGLATILSKYRIDVTQKTPIPMVFSAASPFLSTPGGMWLKIEEIS